MVRVENENGLVVVLCSLGAQLLSLEHKEKESGKLEELTLNYKEVVDLMDKEKNPHLGKTCGRVAGRIAGATFTLDNK